MKRVGQVLKEEREKRGVSLNEIAIATKINIKFLQAIEEGNLEALPQKTFVRGFVRSYAKHLNLDTVGILEAFQEEMGSTRPAAPEPTSVDVGKTTPSGGNASLPGTTPPLGLEEKRTTGTRLLITGGLALLILLIFVIHQTVEKYEKESDPSSRLVSTGASEGLPGAVPSEPNLVIMTPVPSPSLTIPSPSPAATPSPTRAPTPTAAPTPTVPPTPTPTATPSPTRAPSPTLSPKPSPTPVARSTPQEVIVESLDSVVIDFRIDGGALQSLNLNPDQVHTFKASYSITLDVSNGGAVNVIHNGRDRGVPGTLGKSVKLKFP